MARKVAPELSREKRRSKCRSTLREGEIKPPVLTKEDETSILQHFGKKRGKKWLKR